MLEGDLKTTGNPCSIDSIVQDGDYRVYKKSYRSYLKIGVDFAVFKVLNINNQDFMIGFKVSSNIGYKALSIGCFDNNIQLTGYGIELEAWTGNAYNKLTIKEGNFGQNRAFIRCNDLNSDHDHLSSKHHFTQSAN